MTEESRSRRLGDVGDNAPSKWRWGGPGKVPHLVVMFFAESGAPRGVQVQSSTTGGLERSVRCGDVALHLGSRRDRGGRVRRWNQPTANRFVERVAQRDMLTTLKSTTVTSLRSGEFLLGYRNEYGKYTDRPLVDYDDRKREFCLQRKKHLREKMSGKNGTYLVMRQLHQDVKGVLAVS